MGQHNLYDDLENADMPETHAILKREGSNGGHLLAWGDTVPSGVAGYCKGCIFIDTNGANDNTLLVNEGTNTSCSFVAIATD